MEITCPSCGLGFETTGNDNVLHCPNCGAELMVEDKEDGFLLVSVLVPGPEGGTAKPPEEPSEENDPIMADLSQWRHGSLFALLLGVSGMTMICLASYHDYANYGKTFLLNQGNRLFLIGSAAVLGIMVAAGAAIFIWTGRERRRYIASWQASPVKVEHPPQEPGLY